MKKKNNEKHKQFLHVIMIQSNFFLQPLSSDQIIKYCYLYTNWPKLIPFVAVAFIPLLNGKLDVKTQISK